MTFSPANSMANMLDPSIILPDDDEEQLRYVLRQAYIDTAEAVNSREVGFYPLQEIIIGNQYYTSGNPQKFRSVFRKVLLPGSCATGATNTTAHGINNITQIVRLEATCETDVPDYRTIPYTSATLVTNQTEIKVTDTNVIIINGATAPNLSNVTVVLEYTKT